MKKILVTGANGFIGRNCMQYFHERGYEVHGIDRSASNLWGMTIQEVDLLKDDLGKYLNTIAPDVIIHCAGCADVGKSILDPYGDFNGNTVALHKMLFSMKECGLKTTRFIYLSSAAVYGQPESLPISEESNLKPLSPYALHKRMGEDICKYFVENYLFDIKVVRIFSAYGPGLCKQIFWDMNRKVETTGKLDMWGTGEESRDYIYIDDIMQAFFLLIRDKKQKEIIYNVGNGEEIHIKYVAQVFAEVKGVEVKKIKFNGKIREGDPINWRADISRLEKIGYKQQVKFEDGVRKYVDWCNQLKCE